MDISLGTIDWTAISAITSFLMTVAAFATIYSSVRQNKKSRELQIKLLRQQQAQQKLDDMIANIMTICQNMNPFHVFEYSSKLYTKRKMETPKKSDDPSLFSNFCRNKNQPLFGKSRSRSEKLSYSFRSEAISSRTLWIFSVRQAFAPQKA